MFKNYLLTVFRNWINNKLFTFINLCGLTVGLTCAAFIMLFVRDELSYDRWIPDSGNLYRVEVTFNLPGQAPLSESLSPFPMPKAMLDQIPGVTGMTRLMPEEGIVSVENRQFPEHLVVVDPQFFQVIKLPLLEGSADSVFSHESVVISQSIAKKYFGSETGNIGKNLTIKATSCSSDFLVCQNQTHILMITGILRDLPHNTQLAADVVIPNTSAADTMSQFKKEQWGNLPGFGYVSLAQGSDPQEVVTKLKNFMDRSINPDTFVPHMSPSDVMAPRLTRFWDAHLTTDRYQSLTPPGNQATVYGFAVIGVLILLLACFNFTNLAIAGATLRAREISLRKVMGARRGQIVVQFLGEAVLMALLAFFLTLSVIQPLLPAFDRFLSKPIALHYLNDWPILVVIAAISVFAGLVSGLYPAIVLSNFKPAIALRSRAAQTASSSRFRAVLVILQFAASIGLGIAVMVVFAQISHTRHLDLGFRKDNMVIIDHLENMPESKHESFVNTLRKYPGIAQAALGSDIPIVNPNKQVLAFRLPGAASDQLPKYVFIGPEYISTYDVKLLAGRLFSNSHGEDQYALTASSPFNLILNASAARQFGFTPDEAIGKTLSSNGRTGTVIGVVNDIKMAGPQHAAEGTVYLYLPNVMTTVSIHIRPEQLSDTLAYIDKTWSEFVPGFPIQRYFLDGVFNKSFDADEKQGTILSLFVGIAIFIACLGLFGLAAFAAERRTKEIGLRKTFGAKTHHVVLLLLWQFSIPVLIANAIAWPIAYYYLHGWLSGYADRISLNPLYFVCAGFAALAIAWATVYVHAHRIARANPIKALHHE